MPTEMIMLVSRVLMILVGIIAVILVIPRARRAVLGWLHRQFNADFSVTDADGKSIMCHRIMVRKDDEEDEFGRKGGMIKGEKWRNAIHTGLIVGVPEAILLVAATLMLPSYWKLLGIAIFGGLIVLSVGLWTMCFTVIKEREVGLVFRKGHLYGFLRPGWYLIARPFGFEKLNWTVDRNRRETWDLDVKDVLTKDDLQVGFDPVLTIENMDLHTRAPYTIRHPDPATHPAEDTEGVEKGRGMILVEKGEPLPWDLQAPYLRVFRYQMNEATGQQELSEEIRKAVDTISFLYCISSTWDELKTMFAKPAQTVTRDVSEQAIQDAMEANSGGDGETAFTEEFARRFASLQQLIRNYLEQPLADAGLRIADVRIKNIVPPPALLATKTAELEGEAEVRRLAKITKAIADLGELASSPAASFFLTEKSIAAYQESASRAGSVLLTTPPDMLRRLELNLGGAG